MCDYLSTMNIKALLQKHASQAIDNGACVFSLADIASLLGIADKPAVAKIMHKVCAQGLFLNVARGLYVSALHPVNPLTIIYVIANKLRSGYCNYVSLESQLSHVGDISQIPIDRITVMTTGRKGIFKTPYGVIEFTHTKRTPYQIEASVYFDSSINMFRATTTQALADLKRVGRNVNMVESE